MAAHKNAAERTKGWQHQEILCFWQQLGDAHWATLCSGLSPAGKDLSAGPQPGMEPPVPKTTSKTELGKSQENIGNNLLPCSFVGHTIFSALPC